MSEKQKPLQPTQKKPSVGRIVHYQIDDLGSEPFAAMVTGLTVGENSISLAVFDPRGEIRFKVRVKQAEKPTMGHWNWPPVVQ